MERTSSFNSFAKPAKPATYGFVPAPYNKELTPSNLTASKYSMNSMSRESLSSTAVLISTPKLARQNASPHSTPRSFPFGQDEESELGFMLPASPSRCHEASISPFRRPGDGMVDVPLNDLRPSGTTMQGNPLAHVPAKKRRNLMQRFAGDWFEGRADEVCCVAYIVVFKCFLLFVVAAIVFVIVKTIYDAVHK